MNYKQHTSIGVACGVAACVLTGQLTRGYNGYKDMAYVCLGAVMGSLIVDIDSRNSKASQYFSNIFMSIFAMILFGIMFNDMFTSMIQPKVGNALPNPLIIFQSVWVSCYNFICDNIIKDNASLVFFITLTILGKLSPHREFTHKIVGILLFCLTALLTFKLTTAIGFVIGYVMHCLADKTTPAGLKIMQIRLPFQSDNSANIEVLKRLIK